MKTIETITFPASCIGNERFLKVVRYSGPFPTKKAYLQAGIHADEPPGFIVMHHLLKLLDEADTQNKIKDNIILVPVANPIGLNQWRDDAIQGRFHFFDNINFNRNYWPLADKIGEKVKEFLTTDPSQNIALIRQAFKACMGQCTITDEADFLKSTLLTLAGDCDLVLDLHCDFEAALHIYTGMKPDATDLSAQLGAEVTLIEGISQGKTFDQACNQIWWELAEQFKQFPIPPACLAATVELRGKQDVCHEFGKQDAKNLYDYLVRSQFIEDTLIPLPPLKREATPLAGVEYITSEAPGIVIYHKNVGELVQKGEVVVEVLNLLEDHHDKRSSVVRSTTEGILFARRGNRYAKPGRILAKIAGKKPLPGREGNLLTL
ncbi:MAG: succinylglutamate desuccinylase/aspartoacylase family protein [SAR324 cluster bacterium]|nr:succinylglutamate desuccinylase/aspartoacylase family protein [SAR324 cluster bacterium]